MLHCMPGAGGVAAANLPAAQQYKCKNDSESTGVHRRASGTLAPAHGAGAAAAGAAAGRRARKLPPPATLLLLGENGKRPCCCRHFFIAATCLSHVLYGSRPLEFTTRCEYKGGREPSRMSAAAGRVCGMHGAACCSCGSRQQEALQCRQARAGRGGGPSTATCGNSAAPGSTFDARLLPRGTPPPHGSAPPAEINERCYTTC